MATSPDPPPDGCDVPLALLIGAAAVVALPLYALMAVFALVSLGMFVLASPFLLLSERRHRRSIGHPLWDSCLDVATESIGSEKSRPRAMDPPAPIR